MTYIAYETDTFSDKGLTWMARGETAHDVVRQAEDILADYSAQGYTLTLRQLYYQFVARGLVAANTERSYKNLGNLITKARDFGLISWRAIEDRGRSLMGWTFEEDDHECVSGLEHGLNIDRWARMDDYVEVWVEKDALSNVVGRACRKFQVPYMATKGYLSASEAWRAGQRFQDRINDGKRCTLIHLGDHDPEGIDMTRDNQDRLRKYAEDWDIDVKRIALNMDQIEQYSPPPNYAKASSARFDGYVSRFGETCWELDALEPSVIEALITDTVRPLIDWNVWEECSEEQDQKRHYLKQVYDHWDDIKSFLDDINNPDI